MRATPLIWIAAIVTALVVALFAAYVYRRWGSQGDLDAITQNGLIAVTVIAAFWTLWATARNNETTWLAYEESIRPNALFQVLTANPKNNEPISVIRYVNHSRHDMQKMRAIIRIFTDAQSADLSDLLPKDMLLPAGDSRDRKLANFTEPQKHGFDLQSKAAAGEKIKLEIGYSFVHGGTRVGIPVQQIYTWNSAKNMWEVEH